MIDAGDIYRADVGLETRRHVLVVSNRRFHRLAARAIVCPQMETVPDERFPWWIEVDAGTFALDRLASLPVDRLLEPVDRLSAPQLAALRRALAAIS